MCEQIKDQPLTPWLSHNPACASVARGILAPCSCGYHKAAARLASNSFLDNLISRFKR